MSASKLFKLYFVLQWKVDTGKKKKKKKQFFKTCFAIIIFCIGFSTFIPTPGHDQVNKFP